MGQYVQIYRKWLPYARMSDTRGFISRRFDGKSHTGVDSVGNLLSNPICAVIGGTVTKVSSSPTLGNCVEYENGELKLAHYHLAEVKVTVGEHVHAGETVLGIEGRTGSLATGKHLHTSLWINGMLTDPEPYLSGQKAFPTEAVYNGSVRTVIRNDLNLRKGAGVQYESYGMIPLGHLLNITETQRLANGDLWGKTEVLMNDGKVYTGFCNISEKWSRGYAKAVRPGNL